MATNPVDEFAKVLDEVVFVKLLQELAKKKGIPEDDSRLLPEVFSEAEARQIERQVAAMPLEEKVGMWVAALPPAEREKTLKLLKAQYMGGAESAEKH